MVVNNLGRTRKITLVERLLHTSVIYFVCTSVGKWVLFRLICNPMDCSPPGSSVEGIAQARILEWVAVSFSRRSYQLRDQTSSPTMKVDSLLLSRQGSPLAGISNDKSCTSQWHIELPLLTRLPWKWMQSFILEVSVGDRYLCSSSRRKKNIA